MNIKIVTDSTCDLPAEIVDRYGITVIPLYINIGDRGFLDGIEISREDFYRNLPQYSAHPTTAAPGQEKFRQIYENLAREGASEILSIHISESLSATVNIARLGAQAVEGIPVTVFDSRQLTLGMGFLVEIAASEAAAGRSMNEILAALNDQISRTHVFAALDTLEFLKRSGRMNWAIAGLGEILQVKPMLKMYEGNPTSERVRTTNGATNRMVEMLHKLEPLERVALVHTHSPERAGSLLHRVGDIVGEKEVLSVDITPVIGAHLGPGAVGFACVSEKVVPSLKRF